MRIQPDSENMRYMSVICMCCSISQVTSVASPHPFEVADEFGYTVFIYWDPNNSANQIYNVSCWYHQKSFYLLNTTTT